MYSSLVCGRWMLAESGAGVKSENPPGGPAGRIE